MLNSLLWLQTVLDSPHPFQVVLNSLLTKSIDEQEMEISTCVAVLNSLSHHLLELLHSLLCLLTNVDESASWHV